MQSAVNTERVCIIKQKSLSVTRATQEFFCFPCFSGEGFEDDSWESRVRLEQGGFSNEPNKKAENRQRVRK